MEWARILAYITGTVDQELLRRNEYLATENRILRAQLKGRLQLSDADRATLAEIGHRLGRKALEDVANESWMKQIARNVTMDEWGFLESRRYLIHDRDTKFTDSFRAIVKSSHVEPLKLPAQSPNLNVHAERWVKSVKDECLSKLILLGEASLRRALREYLVHHHTERNHQGKGNVLLFPTVKDPENRADVPVRCRERLGGLLKYYHREAA